MQYRSVVKLRTKDDEIIYAEYGYDFGEGIGAAPRYLIMEYDKDVYDEDVSGTCGHRVDGANCQLPS